jgi:hypothetical protein
VQLVGVALVICVEDSFITLADVWFYLTLVQGVFVFSASSKLLFALLQHGSNAFAHFSFVRTLLSVIMILTLSIFYLQIMTQGASFQTTADIAKIDTITERLDLFVACVYTAFGILSSVGYGDIVPKTWYARLVVLPNFLFTFLANVIIFTAFSKFYAQQASMLSVQPTHAYPLYEDCEEVQRDECDDDYRPRLIDLFSKNTHRECRALRDCTVVDDACLHKRACCILNFLLLCKTDL